MSQAMFLGQCLPAGEGAIKFLVATIISSQSTSPNIRISNAEGVLDCVSDIVTA
jgi:hypothetical protein